MFTDPPLDISQARLAQQNTKAWSHVIEIADYRDAARRRCRQVEPRTKLYLASRVENIDITRRQFGADKEHANWWRRVESLCAGVPGFPPDPRELEDMQRDRLPLEDLSLIERAVACISHALVCHGLLLRTGAAKLRFLKWLRLYLNGAAEIQPPSSDPVFDMAVTVLRISVGLPPSPPKPRRPARSSLKRVA